MFSIGIFMMVNYHVLLAVSSSGGCIYEEIGMLSVMVILQRRLSFPSREALSDDVSLIVSVFIPSCHALCIFAPSAKILFCLSLKHVGVIRLMNNHTSYVPPPKPAELYLFVCMALWSIYT